jgi:hypothetical protein
MLETIRMENVRVHMSLVSYSNLPSTDRPIIHRGGKYYPPADEFVYLRTKVINLSRTFRATHSLQLILKKTSARILVGVYDGSCDGTI